MNLLHRDDFNDEEIQDLQKLFPGMKIVFAGDSPDLPKEIKQSLVEMEKKNEESRVFGLCIDCGKKMPGYPEEELPENWEKAEGWVWFSQFNQQTGEDDLVAWLCPECDAKENT